MAPHRASTVAAVVPPLIDKPMQMVPIGRILDRARLARVADGLAVGVAVSLPWTTSGTSILIALWLLALVPTLDVASLRRILLTPAGGLPVALWMLALVGLLWSVAPLAEGIGGFKVFFRLLAIPLLMVQYRRSDRGIWVLGGFLAACTALLLASWATKFWPSLTPSGAVPGVPVKEYVVQSGEFLLCAFALAHLVFESWRQNRRWLALALAVLALVFLGNIVFVATARASLVVFAVLLGVFGLQRFGWKGALGVIVAGAVLAAAAWASSPYLRGRALGVFEEIRSYETENAETSSGYRLEFWKKSLSIIASAPLTGHGTGATPEMFRRLATGDGISAAVTDNPHNQTLSIAIQFGLVGVVVLYGMWFAHLLLFRGAGLPAWIGLAVVVQNIVASLFNSQIFYFTPGWTYVFGVGVLGGMVLGADRAEQERRPP
jgi:hypothetical protein